MNSALPSFPPLLVICIAPVCAYPNFLLGSNLEIGRKKMTIKVNGMQPDTTVVSDLTSFQGNTTKPGRFLTRKSTIPPDISAEDSSVTDLAHLKPLNLHALSSAELKSTFFSM